jgi:hypothetical protein
VLSADLDFYQAFLSTTSLAALRATVAWWRTRKRALRAEAEAAALRAAVDQTGLRHSVEAIALEVERIGEGQRYLTRRFAESNLPTPSGSRSARSEGEAPR